MAANYRPSVQMLAIEFHTFFLLYTDTQLYHAPVTTADSKLVYHTYYRQLRRGTDHEIRTYVRFAVFPV